MEELNIFLNSQSNGRLFFYGIFILMLAYYFFQTIIFAFKYMFERKYPKPTKQYKYCIKYIGNGNLKDEMIHYGTGTNKIEVTQLFWKNYDSSIYDIISIEKIKD